MWDTADEVEFTLKLMINNQKNKVLFAEADSGFTEVLLSFLTLPLGRIVKVLEGHYGEKAPVIGSLTTLYKGLTDLNLGDLWEYKRYQLLNAYTSLEAEEEDEDGIPLCKKMKSQNSGNASVASVVNVGEIGGLTEKTASFIITDDLQIAPVVPGSVLQTFINVGITEPVEAELRILTVGFSEIVDILKGSLLSKTPLTDLVFLERGKIDRVTEKLLQEASKGLSPPGSKKMTVKAMVQKSTNKILFVQGDDDFVDFICSFLIIPLGGVECLLGGNTCLRNIDNFYKSIKNIDGDKFLKDKDTKDMLLKPKLSKYYNSDNHFLPFAEKGLLTSKSGITWNFVKQQKMYNVTDDLVVTPFCMASSFSLLSQHNILFSDVNEVELVIGSDEALRILKASLTSNSALTDGLMNSISKRQLKQEH